MKIYLFAVTAFIVSVICLYINTKFGLFAFGLMSGILLMMMMEDFKNMWGNSI